MPKIRINNLDHYYEQSGEGPSLVFVHGAFADARIWEPQWKHFSSKYRLLRYDLRGHGRTGDSDLTYYSISTFADDLISLMDKLRINSPIVCGLSMGGVIAQAFAVRNPGQPKALVLAGTAVSASLTLSEKLLRFVLLPRWAMLLIIRMVSVENFIQFSLWLARVLWGKHWLGRDEATREYLVQCMLRMNGSEYLKMWGAIYGFDLLPLGRITCPTLVLNGEHESRSTFRHTEEILRRVPQSVAKVIPAAGHALNMENPKAFNTFVMEFLQCST